MLDYQKVAAIDAHLDAKVSQAYKDQPLAQDWARVCKAAEEHGEAVDALIGMTGQNPRKGEYGELADLLKELADVMFTGLLAIQHFTKDADETERIVTEHLDHLYARVTPC